MNINKYTTFLKVVELGSITKAASVLGHTQSGVTQLLHSLENELGVSLLMRGRQGIQLTREGTELYPLIRDIVVANEKLHDTINQMTETKEQIIRIGTFTSVAVNWLPDIIKEYQQVAEDIHFELIDCGYNNIEEELTNKQMDFAFVPLPIKLNCKCLELYKDRLLAVLPNNHPQSEERSCPISVFESEPVISLMPDIDRDAQSVFTTNRITPNIKYSVKDDYAMLAMVKKNLGICIMPELLLDLDHPNYKALELEPPAYRTIGIAFPNAASVKKSALHFADFAAKWIQQHNN